MSRTAVNDAHSCTRHIFSEVEGLTCESFRCKNHAMRRLPILVVKEGFLEGTRMPIPEQGLILGRGENCDLTLPDQGVSREHCKILLHNSGIWVRDEGSRNGVFLKGKRINRPKQMMPGDELKVGDHLFTVELGPLLSGEDTVSVVSVGPPPDSIAPTIELEPARRSLVVPVIGALVVVAVVACIAQFAG